MALYTTEVARTFAQGTVPSGGTQAYTVGGGSAATIRHMMLANGGTADVGYAVYRNGTSSAYRGAGGTVSASGYAEFNGALDMGAGDYLYLTGAGLTFTISGVEFS